MLAKRAVAPVEGVVLLAYSDVSGALSTAGELVDILREYRRSVHRRDSRSLSRIVEITGGDVMADPDHQLELQIALLVLRLQGRLPGAAHLPQSQTAISSPGIHE